MKMVKMGYTVSCEYRTEVVEWKIPPNIHDNILLHYLTSSTLKIRVKEKHFLFVLFLIKDSTLLLQFVVKKSQISNKACLIIYTKFISRLKYFLFANINIALNKLYLI